MEGRSKIKGEKERKGTVKKRGRGRERVESTPLPFCISGHTTTLTGCAL